jgi:hypothetical protein
MHESARVSADERTKQYTGMVVRKRFAPGSKSERSAVMLKALGREYVLRREDADRLVDPELEKLVGKNVRVRGSLHRHALTVTEIEEIAPPPPPARAARKR